MTVQQLIAALSQCDPDLPVIMPGERDYDFCEVRAVYADLARFEGFSVELTDERESERTSVVRLFGPESEFGRA
ncbi:hypothetical protein KOAAANKH_00735 [Brevundimonas sp. NIBR10]|uniref:hypothetical protein n=1 Tax=Brevundimonas sp. NIBR10 TaxID=3015997 RepID=UPI0022F15623|nr:hypothetical protein [Brevundimonas sp. NIBR10]WGM45870.1 hypothetical protein KOAAANKH_00735 [Brevundimonas sp. NIBR10]